MDKKIIVFTIKAQNLVAAQDALFIILFHPSNHRSCFRSRVAPVASPVRRVYSILPLFVSAQLRSKGAAVRHDN